MTDPNDGVPTGAASQAVPSAAPETPQTGQMLGAGQTPEAIQAPEGNQAAAAPAQQRPARPQRALWVRIIGGIAILVTGWHLFASFLWIAPSSPLREVVPGNALNSYMLPMFGQSWSVFAPEPVNGDFYFEVRAQLGDGRTETEWVRATDVEMAMTMGNLFPPRAGIMASELANKLKGRFEDLSTTKQQVVAGPFTGDDWQQQLEQQLNGDTAADKNDATVGEYLAQERMAAAYATQVARAMWGDDVTAVQYRAGRQNVIPFADRNAVDAERPAASFVEPGWRAPLVVEGQNEQNFQRVFKRQAAKLGLTGETGDSIEQNNAAGEAEGKR